MSEENKSNNCNTLPNISRREFLKQVGLTTAGLLVGCGSDQQNESSLLQPDATEFALINGAIIDGTGADAILDGVVVIRDRFLTDVGPRTEIEIPSGVEQIDVQGGTIMPGFINAHVHAAFDMDILRAWPRGGVTTIRDLSAFGPYDAEVFNTRDELNADPKCARLIAVGKFINVSGGYPIVYWGGYAITVSSPETARQAVHRIVDEGADIIKTAFESGYAYGQSGWPLLDPDSAKALVETAHERGKPVTAHVTSGQDLEYALDAGVDEIAHMVVDTIPVGHISRMIETGTSWVPTLELWQGISSEYCSTAINNLSRFLEAGGEISLGTDYAGAPNINFDLGMPANEIGLMQAAGMTPMQIIVAATRNGARSCNMEDELGTLEAGKLADVLVVNGDPLTDIYALVDTIMVLREGRSI